MKLQDDKKLDNPVWHSLLECHQNFTVGYDNIKFYHPDYCPFGGFEKDKNVSRQIDEYSKMIDDFFIVGEKPPLSNQLTIKKEMVCLQMIISDKIEWEIKEQIVKLTHEHIDMLHQFVDSIQPRYFKKKTALLGNYFGIFEKGEIIAVTGERMNMNDFTEVSAVVTHPNHTGKGLAKQLITHCVNTIFDKNKTPYLHVVDTNVGAIKLYEKLGFKVRRKISFWNVTR